MTGEYDASTDLYGLGVLAYELLTGKLPGRRSPMPSEVDDRIPKRFDDIFDRLTRDEPGDRYASVDDFVGELVAAVPKEWVGDGATVPLRAASETVEVPEPVV